jgi:glycosyltransferase involved in cell wall biosynthesis
VAIAQDPSADSAVPAAPAPTRVATIGISIDDPCGVRDHAALLADGLAADGFTSSLHWLSRSAGPIVAERSELRGWAAAIPGELASEHAEAVLLHYSVFAFAHRGVPIYARPVLAAIRRSRLPLVTFMHEYAYPWQLGGARGKLWAATQRFVLREVVRASSALVASADARAGWLRSRAWLPDRAISVAPVFSNLPATLGPSPAPAGARELGLFGYGHEGVDFSTVLDALRAVRERAGDVRLTLLGAPGSPSPAAARWEREAAARGLAGAIGFSGRLPAQQLADALAACDVLLFAERGGATSRKTTLAASLSSARPVVALDGSNGWSELSRAGAATIVEPHARALADAIERLLADRDERERQGELGRRFAARAMSVENSATVVGAALRRAIGEARD